MPQDDQEKEIDSGVHKKENNFKFFRLRRLKSDKVDFYFQSIANSVSKKRNFQAKSLKNCIF